MQKKDEKFMRVAIELAKEAGDRGEVPVGAVVVYENEIIGMGRNSREENKNAICHAEILAIDEACKHIGNWRLENCSIYVTLEPCPMCAGAIVNARLRNLIFGANDPIFGAAGSVINVFEIPAIYTTEITGGVFKEECSSLLKSFFKNIRKR